MARRPEDLPRVFLGATAVAEGWLAKDDLRGPSVVRLLQGVYAPSWVTRDHTLVCEGAGLVLPAGVQLTGASAATVLGLAWLRHDDPVEAVTEERDRRSVRRGVRVRRSRRDLEPGRAWRTAVLASPERVAFDAACRAPLPTAVARLDALAAAGHLDLDAMVGWLQGRRDGGVARVRAALELTDPRAESLPESRLRVLLVQAGVDVTVQHVVRDRSGAFVARVDLAVVSARVAVEYDGRWHAQPDQLEKDRRRLNKLQAAGWTVVHVTAADMSDPGRVVAMVVAAVARAAA